MDYDAVLNLGYETQHFNFHPRIFLDNVYNAFYENIFEALTQMKKFLSEEYSEVVTVDSINVKTEALFQHLVKKLDKAIDKLEVYLNANIFMVPNHVVLPEDKVHVTNPCTKEEDEELCQEVEEIKQRIIEERIMRHHLKSKIAEQKSLKKELLIFQNKLQQILIVVEQSRITQEDLRVTMAKCCELLQNSMKQHPQLK